MADAPKTEPRRAERLELARMVLRSGDTAEARRAFEGLVEEAIAAGEGRLRAEALLGVAEALAREGAPEQGLLGAEQAAQAARDAGATSVVADALLLQADLLQTRDETTRARARLEDGTRALDAAAEEARVAGDLEAALAHHRRAAETRDLLLSLADGAEAPPLRVLRLDREAGGSEPQDRDLLRTLYDLSRRLVAEREPSRVIVSILDIVVQATGAERGFVLLRPEADLPAGEGGRLPRGLEVAAARNFDRATISRPHLKVSRAAVAEALQRGEPLVVHDAGREELLAGHTSVDDQKLRSIACVPFSSPRGLEGALYLDNRFSQGAFSAATLEALDAFAAHAAVALENSRLHAVAARERDELDRARARAEELARRLSSELSRTGEALGAARARLEEAEGRLALRAGLGELVGRSRAMQPVYAFVDKVAAADQPVLVRGESGTGKELVARAIHAGGPRQGEPFASENCGAIPESLLESLLFGHEEGAFTGATERRAGILERAAAGTLFLDEVGELPLSSQAALLRVLEERRFRRVGGSEEVPFRARLLAATHRDLEAMVRAGSFREDLYYRLNVLSVRVPPLRERRDDLPLLLEHLVTAAAEGERSAPSFTPAAERTLLRYTWPGNVRELQNEVRRLLTLAGDTVDVADLSAAIRAGGEEASAAPAEDSEAIPTLQEGERRLVLAALQATGGNKARAASLLGIARGTLWHKMKQHHIEG